MQAISNVHAGHRLPTPVIQHENGALLFGRGNSQLVQTRSLLANNEIHKPFLLNSRVQGVSGKNERSSQTPWRGPMQLHRLKAGPVERHAMTEVSILLSALNQMARNLASIFCHEIMKELPVEHLAVTRGTLGFRRTPVEKHCPRLIHLWGPLSHCCEEKMEKHESICEKPKMTLWKYGQ